MTDEMPSPRSIRSRPSLVDVARVAGISPITVSRVANGHQSVSEQTRRRVLEAMTTVGYNPNYAARALATGRFGTIGVLTFTMATYGNARTIAATVASAEQLGYAVTLLTAPRTAEGERSALDRLLKQAVDGVIVIMEAHLLDGSGLVVPQGLPVVVADSGGASQYCVVDIDQAGGARQATQHLIDLGHDTVWHVAGPRTSFSANARVDGWRATLRDAGRIAPHELVGDWTADSGYRHGLTLAAMPEVTAVFAANDHMALGVMRAFHEVGRAIPQQVSIVGFDDTEDSGAYWPPLTTVHQDFDEVGRLCVQSLLHEIRHDTGQIRTHIVPTSLTIRQSTR